MSLRVMIEIRDDARAALSNLAGHLQDPSALHAKIAGDAEAFVKARGRQTSQTEHRTAATLGARPTGHLEQAYEGIESISDDRAATLLVPSASRLRAAFGSYVLTPKNSQYLTIPVSAEAYGKRAGEVPGLEPMRVGPRKTLVLARDQGDGRIETIYVLVKSATIPEDRGLLPFDELVDVAADSALEFVDDAIEETVGGGAS